MANGKLEPSFEEVIASQGQKKGVIHIYLYEIATAKVGTTPTPESVNVRSTASGREIIVSYRNRDVSFSVEDLISEAVDLIDKELEANSV
jgi:hypothetical protein